MPTLSDPIGDLPALLSGLGLVELMALGFDLDLSAEQRDAQVADGTWHVFGLRADFGGLGAGVRLLPGRALLDCPVVRYESGSCTTLATCAATLVPMTLVERQSFSQSAWGDLVESWPDNEGAMAGLHAALDGDPAILEVLEETLEDSSSAAMTDGAIQPDRRLRDVARGQVMLRLDDTPEHQLARTTIQRAIQHGKVPAEMPDGLGAWTMATASNCFTVAQNVKADARPFAWALICGPAGVDTDILDTPTHRTTPGGLTDNLLRRAALALLADPPEGVEADPRWPCVQHVADRSKHALVAYMEAAAALDQAGDHDGAWDCLVSAGFWGRLTLGACPPAVVDAARAMVMRQNWPDTQRVLEDMAARYNASLE